MSKREVLLDRNSLIEHLKGCGHEEDMLLGMSDKGLFELYSNAMYENDLENYHVSDATEDVYSLGDDIELEEVVNKQTFNLGNPKDKEEFVNTYIGGDKNDFDGSGQISITQSSNESARFDKKTLEEKFAKAKAKVEEKEISEEDNTDEGRVTKGWRRLKRRGGKHYVSTVGGDDGLGINKPKPRTDESFEADKKLVMEMINKHHKPSATKGKIMEYILNKSK